MYAEDDPVNLSDPTGREVLSRGQTFQLVLRNPAIWQAAWRVAVAGADVVARVMFAGLEFYCIMKRIGSTFAALGLVQDPFWTTGFCSD